MQVKSTDELADMNSSQLLGLLDEARDCSRIAGIKWADAVKKFKDSKELLPSKFGEIIKIYSETGAKSQMVRWQAVSDKNYQDEIIKMNQLEYESNLLEIEYRGWMKTIDALVSIAYVRNNELKLSR